MSGLLPTNNRDLAPVINEKAGGSSSGSGTRGQASSTHSGSTQVGGDEVNEKQRSSDMSDEKIMSSRNNDYEDKGIVDIEDEGVKRQVRVILENRTGKEVFKEMSGGEYTIPRW
jgi:hypothetical protein